MLGKGQVVHQSQVQPVLQKAFLNFPGVGHQGGEPHLGAALPELGQQGGEPGRPQGHVGPHPQPGGSLAQLLLRLLEAPEDVLGLLVQGLPGGGEVHPAVHPLEELCPVVLLQLPDGQAHRGLGGAQGLGGFAEALQAAGLGKNGQVFAGHGAHLYEKEYGFYFIIKIENREALS